MSITDSFVHLRNVDSDAVKAIPAGSKYQHWLLDETSGGKNCRIRYEIQPPGHATKQAHTHPYDQLFYVLSGETTFDIDDTTVTAGPDTLVVVHEGMVHQNRNVGTLPAEYVTFKYNIRADESSDGFSLIKNLGPDERNDNKVPYLRKFERDYANAAPAGWRHRQWMVNISSDNGKRCRLAHDTDPPGRGTRRQGKHTHEYDEVSYVISGEMIWYVGETTLTAGPGSLVVVPEGTVHQFMIRGDVPVEYLTFDYNLKGFDLLHQHSGINP